MVWDSKEIKDNLLLVLTVISTIAAIMALGSGRGRRILGGIFFLVAAVFLVIYLSSKIEPLPDDNCNGIVKTIENGHYSNGMAYFESGRLPEAVEEFNRSLDNDFPKFTTSKCDISSKEIRVIKNRAHYYLATAYLRLQECGSALREYGFIAPDPELLGPRWLDECKQAQVPCPTCKMVKMGL